MRIFVGYRYGPRDVWVSKYVYRLVRAFSSEVVDGESVYSAHSLADGIVDSIINGRDGFTELFNSSSKSLSRCGLSEGIVT